MKGVRDARKFTAFIHGGIYDQSWPGTKRLRRVPLARRVLVKTYSNLVKLASRIENTYLRTIIVRLILTHLATLSG
jgi:uncharacterized membrane protein YfbV (UPF0208 family)